MEKHKHPNQQRYIHDNNNNRNERTGAAASTQDTKKPYQKVETGRAVSHHALSDSSHASVRAPNKGLVPERRRSSPQEDSLSGLESILSRVSLYSMIGSKNPLSYRTTASRHQPRNTLEWMIKGGRSQHIQEQGVTMLYMLSKVGRLSDIFNVSDFTETLVYAMRAFPASESILLWGVQLFHNLALEDPSNMEKMVKKQAVRAAVNAMKNHPHRGGIQRGGCLFLEVLAEKKRWYSEIMEAGGLDAAGLAQQNHQNCIDVVFPAQQVLTKVVCNLGRPATSSSDEDDTEEGEADNHERATTDVGQHHLPVVVAEESLSPNSSIEMLTDHTKLIQFNNAWLRDIDGRWGRYTGSCIRQIASDNEYKPHGRGEMRYDDGYVFRGRWEYGKWKGEGQLAYPEGHVYNGNFQYKMSSKGRNTAGRLFGVYARHGEGTIRYKDDQYYHSYKGSWNDGLPHGRGRMVYADKSVYEGYFVQGKRQGQGVYQQEDGTCYNGAWEDDTYHDYGILSLPVGEDQKPNKYEGFFVDGKFSGQGVRQWPDGRVYRGEWRDGKTDGRGRLEHPDGYVYHGSFQDDRIESVSRLVCPSGSVYSGEFVRVGDDDESTFEGIGEVKYDDGSVYRGSFVGWKPHGYGLFLDISGARCEGQWLHGTWDGQGTTFSSEDSENSESAQKPE